MTARFSLRRRLRQARSDLPADLRRKANAQIHRALTTHPRFRRARHVALYFSHGGEACVAQAMRHAHAAGKTVLMPRVFGSRLLFIPWTPGTRCLRGRYGIPYPAQRHPPRLVRTIDLVVTPLVAFDHSGARLGQGGGYYDRALACRLNSAWRRPYLIGVAFGLQCVDTIETRRWDVPLDTVLHDTITAP